MFESVLGSLGTVVGLTSGTMIPVLGDRVGMSVVSLWLCGVGCVATLYSLFIKKVGSQDSAARPEGKGGGASLP